jgi:hypothetical protein
VPTVVCALIATAIPWKLALIDNQQANSPKERLQVIGIL